MQQTQLHFNRPYKTMKFSETGRLIFSAPIVYSAYLFLGSKVHVLEKMQTEVFYLHHLTRKHGGTP